MSLKVVIGPMFSGKTTYLLSEIETYKGYKILCINHRNDNLRYNMQLQALRTHDDKIHESLMLTNLQELYFDKELNSYYNEADIIIIDEGQFFSDLFKFIYDALNNHNVNKKFIVAGLKSDYLMRPLGDMCLLVSMSDEIIELFTYCKHCNNKALFTRIVNKLVSSSGIYIGGSEHYESVCRNHLKY